MAKKVAQKSRTLAKNNSLLVIGIAVVAALGSFLLVNAVSQKSSSPSKSNCQGICVALSADGAEPDELSVKVGEYVQFNSADGKKHNLGLSSGSRHGGQGDSSEQYNSGDFAADEAWRVQFKQTGSYELTDRYNPKQTILIVVYKPKTDQAI